MIIHITNVEEVADYWKDHGIPADEIGSIESAHHVAAPLGGNQWLVVLTGIAVPRPSPKGSSDHGDFNRSQVKITLHVPYAFIPEGKEFEVQHWAPFLTLNGIASGEPDNPAWAVESFEGPGEWIVGREKGTNVRIKAQIQVRDHNARMWRIGYHVTMLGILRDFEELSP